MSVETPDRLLLRRLPLPARLVLSAFLISVGIGYVSALVQLHFQHAKPGNAVPTPEDAARIYHGVEGARPISQIERLLEADPSLEFSGTGQMRTAFSSKSKGWEAAVANRMQKDEIDEKKAEELLTTERDVQRQSMLAWIRAGAKKSEWEKNAFVLPPEIDTKHLPAQYMIKEGNKTAVKIQLLFENRCSTCHNPKGEASEFPLVNFEKDIRPRVTPEAGAGNGAMSLTKLAQTTHVHLLGFSMLYGMTGLILAFSSYPCWLKVILCPLPLVAQVIDISCWWLARIDPMFAHVIMITGGIVALSLVSQIILSLLDMYQAMGKVVVLLMLGIGGAGMTYGYFKVVVPYLEKEAVPNGVQK